MDAVTRLLDQVLPGLTTVQQGAMVAGVVAVIAAAAVGAVVLRRRRRRPTPVDSVASTGVVRRPIYTDPVLIDDLWAHVETRDFSRDLRDALEADDPDRRPEGLRRLNRVLQGLDERPDLLLDLDQNPEANLPQGRAVQITGTLTRTPATDAAELLELGRPLLANGGQERPARSPIGEPEQAPLLLRLTPDTGGSRRYLLVMDREGLWTDHPIPPTSVVMLGVVEEVLDDKESRELSDLIRSRASMRLREALGDRDVAETAATLSEVTPTPLKPRELVFDGPGARIAPAAIYR